jgi:sortase A
MTKSKLYKKSQKKDVRKATRIVGLALSICGVIVMLYIFTPYVSYQFNFADAFASQSIKTPIPQVFVVSNNNSQQNQSISNSTDGNDNLLNAQNWFPTYNTTATTVQPVTAKPRPSSYFLTIPKLGVTNAVVSTSDMDLSQHLVDYPGTAIPPEKGNAVDFGHSTLTWLFNPSNYKTILATAYKLTVGDEFIVTVDDQQYTYDIYNITVVNPDDTSVFAQNYDDSYLTLITCTPPGTTFQRLVIKSRLRQ